MEAASRLLGVSAVQLSRYETGARRIPAERVQAIAKLTGVPPHTLRPDVFGADADAAIEPPAADEPDAPSVGCTSGAGHETGSALSISPSRLSDEAA